MTQAGSNIEELITRFRLVLPAQSATAKAIDCREPWSLVAMKAVDEGYIEYADEFVRFIESSLRRSG